MAGKFHAIRMLITREWDSSVIWAGDQVSNTLHFGLCLTPSQPSVNQGPWTIPDNNSTDEGGTFAHTTGGWTFTCERGWAVENTANWDDVFKTLLDKWIILENHLSPYIAKQSYLRDIRLYPVGEDGKSTSLGPFIAAPTTRVDPTATGMVSPDMAAVFSLYSALRTKRGRGRYYFGPLKQGMLSTSNGLLDNSFTGNAQTWFAEFLSAARDIESGAAGTDRKTLTPVVLHRAAPYNVAAVISKVRLGDEVDHQERRTKLRNETYTEALVT